METLDYDHNVFNSQQRDADRSLAVRFFTHPLKNDAKSEAAGRPIFEDTEMVEIRVRGDRNHVVSRPVRDTDKQRFRDAYAAFRDGQKELLTGTPLAEWPIASKSMVEELRYLGFTTVEQVAEANDNTVAKVPGLSSLKSRAKAFLDLAKGLSPIETLQSQLETEKSKSQALEAQIADLSARFARLEAQKGAGPEDEDEDEDEDDKPAVKTPVRARRA
jgi:hypothetical protein